MRARFLALLIVFPMLAPYGAGAEEDEGATGLPIPRFVSLRSGQVNMRAGPGTRYPIEWVYQNASMPVEIISELGNWRQIRDFKGEDGWMHHSMLSGKRSAIVTGAEPAPVFSDADQSSNRLMMAEPGVIAQVSECEEHWCELLLDNRKGWIAKSRLWGIYPQEIFD